MRLSVLLLSNQSLSLFSKSICRQPLDHRNAPTPEVRARRFDFLIRYLIVSMRNPNWWPTSFERPSGTVQIVPDDWTLYDNTGRPVARIYGYLFGPNAGRWFWTVLNAGAGYAATAAEAREICEAMIPPGAHAPELCADEVDAE